MRSWMIGLFTLGTSFLWIFLLVYKAEAQTGRTIPSPQREPVFQSRGNVCRDLFFSDPQSGFLQTRILSDHSLFRLEPIGSSMQAQEELHNVSCWNQEKVTDSDEQIRFFKADHGTYHYKTQTFCAEKASLSLYKLQGRTLLFDLSRYTPFLSGSAQTITLSIKQGIPLFEAQLFKASLRAEAP